MKPHPSPLPLLLSLLMTAGCSVDPSDISLDAPQHTNNEDMDSGSSPPAERPDGGESGGEPPERTIDASDEHPLPNDGMEAGILEPTDDDDGGPVDEDDGGEELPSDPCMDGTYACVPYEFFVKVGELGLPGAHVVVTIDEYAWELTTDTSARAFFELPPDRTGIIHISAPTYWDQRFPIRVPITGQVGGVMAMSNKAFLDASVIELGIHFDETKGYIIATFYPVISGSAVSIDLPSGDAFIRDAGGKPVVGNTLVEGSKEWVGFPNVEPGTFTATIASPPGLACALWVDDQSYVALPHTVTLLPILCMATAP